MRASIQLVGQEEDLRRAATAHNSDPLAFATRELIENRSRNSSAGAELTLAKRRSISASSSALPDARPWMAGAGRGDHDGVDRVQRGEQVLKVV